MEKITQIEVRRNLARIMEQQGKTSDPQMHAVLKKEELRYRGLLRLG